MTSAGFRTGAALGPFIICRPYSEEKKCSKYLYDFFPFFYKICHFRLGLQGPRRKYCTDYDGIDIHR